MLTVRCFIFPSLLKLEARNFILTSRLVVMEQLPKCSEGSATLLIALDFPGNGMVHKYCIRNPYCNIKGIFTWVILYVHKMSSLV